MPVTIKDIARAANVSHTTVSRALGTGSSVSDETARRIRTLAREMGYIPNSAARSLKTRHSRVIGVLMRRLDDPYFSDVLRAFEDVAGAAGYSLFVAAARRNREREREIVREMSRQRVEGVLICASDVSPEHRRGLEEFGVRTVLLNNQAPDSLGGAVYHDDFSGTLAITEHLLALGHTRIGWIGNANAGSTSHDRLQGYRAGLRRAGVAADPDLAVEAPNGMAAGGVEGARELLRIRNRPTAIVAFNDMVALGAIHALHNLRLRVPGDCSVTGFDNIDIAACIHPPLTTFSQPRYALGERAIAMLLGMIEGRETNGPRTERLCGELVVRDSTAPPPATLPACL
jgi:DNA-binding LacI/PurR family transcriptional regulator